ncbi:MAG: hypothetical protein IJP33_00740 [Firmicutes bacterium]|nr:hypothetical protein [Bacillota bacterium]
MTVNSANAGRVSVAFASEDAISTGDLMQITFVAKENISGTASITMQPEDLTNDNANPITSTSVSSNLTITEKSRVWLALSNEMNTHESFTVGFWVEGSSGFAAGDFVINYDDEKLECLSVTSDLSSGEGNTSSNAFVVINDEYQNGEIKFSVLCANGISRDTQFLTIEFRAKYAQPAEFELIPVAETTPVNREGDAILLQCPAASGTIT